MPYLPSVIYELMPTLYLLLAVFGLRSSENWVGTLCSVALLGAAGTIVHLRAKARGWW